MISKRTIRLVLAALLVSSLFAVGGAWATRPSTLDSAPEADGVTVITKQGRQYLDQTARIVAYNPDGSILYQERQYDTYFDVDPVPNTTHTVVYLGVDYVRPAACPDDLGGTWCAQQVLVRTNLSTGDREIVQEWTLPKLHKYHDIDRYNETHWVLADIYQDEVEFVNESTGEVTWSWNANESFDYETSGGEPGDWTHVNDVEVVRNGWIMASLRNHDQVVFLDPGNGLVENWTLGCDGCHDVLYEQHNPDFVDGETPYVLVADSENDRVVEFRRENGSWVETWTWTGADVKWPRDADRLPNGNTLVTDSNANRVVEIAPNGSIVWSTTIGNPYEAERLGTAPESVGPPHAPGHQVAGNDAVGRVLLTIRETVPSKWLSAALFVSPYWVGLPELLAIALGALALVVWVALEVRWRLLPRLERSERLRVPFR